jgi:hypothetical protein
VMSSQKQTNPPQDLREALRVCAILGVLIVLMLITHNLLGLPSIVAIVVSCTLGYFFSVAFLRPLLPPRQSVTDDYRIQNTPRLRMWLAVDVICIILVHFGGDVAWLLAVGAIVLLSLCFVLVEVWLRRRAVRRIA